MNAKEKIEELLEASEDGTITAAQVTEAGLHRSVLQEFVTDARRFQRPRRRFKENDFALTSSQILFLVTGFFVFAIQRL